MSGLLFNRLDIYFQSNCIIMITNNLQHIEELKLTATHCLFLADIHFGVRQNAEEWQQNHLDYFNNFFIPLVKQVQSNLSDSDKLVIFVLGDINDNRKAIDINVNNIAINIIEQIRQLCPVYLMTGNHDLSKKTNKGNNSIRSYAFLDNVYEITQPTHISVIKPMQGRKKPVSIIAVPYLGDFNEETKCLVEYKDKAQFAFMHTEIAKMQMDNGMSITNGINPDAFTGRIFSGHIHKRQETKKVVYLGSPFHTGRGDANNDKGVYLLNFHTGELQFFKNDYSPKFQNIQMDYFLNLDLNQRKELLDNNYNFIIIDESKLASYKKSIDIYNMKEGTNARTVRPVINRQHAEILSELDISAGNRENTIEELIIQSIKQLEVSDQDKEQLLLLNEEYFKSALERMATDI